MGYLDSLAHFYDLSTPVALPDLGIPGGNPGTGANIASNPVGIHGKSVCAEFNGNNSYYDLGDVVELNAVAALTIAFWMRQDVLDQTDYILSKQLDATHYLYIFTHVGGGFYLRFNDGGITEGYWDYSADIAAATWAHVAWVFDGSGAANADRLKCYVNAIPVTLSYTGTIAALTPDLSGATTRIGRSSSAFDGLLDAFAIFSRPLTQIQVADFRKMTMQGRL